LGLAALALLVVLNLPLSGFAESAMTKEERHYAIEQIRTAYAAFNRGDIDSAVRMLDAHVEWSEPVEFPGGGTCHGIEGAKRYLSQSRAGAAQVISQPERFITAGSRIVVFVHARVLPKGSTIWQDIRLADVYTFRQGKVIAMHAFADREEALRWAGVSARRRSPSRSDNHK
jgi:ketosteroid isomerase-like protein